MKQKPNILFLIALYGIISTSSCSFLQASSSGDRDKANLPEIPDGQATNIDNPINPTNTVPGKLQAEDYSRMLGTTRANGSDSDQSDMMARIGAGDYLEYNLSVGSPGFYNMNFRAKGNGVLRILNNGIRRNEVYIGRNLNGAVWLNTGNIYYFTSGMNKLRLEGVSGDLSLNWIDIEPMRLVWSDEFDSGVLPDTSKWSYEVQKPGWVNDEKQNYTGDRLQNSRISNGMLIIEADNDNFGGYRYSSARLKTAGKGYWLYGRIEAGLKLPSGIGSWPAFWLMPEDYYGYGGGWPDSGEIDIMEHVGYDPGVIHGTSHCKAYYWKNGLQKTSSITDYDVTNGFHVYAIEWTADKIDFYLDDTNYLTVTNEYSGWECWPFDKPFYIILNLAVGGSWGGSQGIDDSSLPWRMFADYVRVYQ